jgi:hypothetical protein
VLSAIKWRISTDALIHCANFLIFQGTGLALFVRFVGAERVRLRLWRNEYHCTSIPPRFSKLAVSGKRRQPTADIHVDELGAMLLASPVGVGAERRRTRAGRRRKQRQKPLQTPPPGHYATLAPPRTDMNDLIAITPLKTGKRCQFH